MAFRVSRKHTPATAIRRSVSEQLSKAIKLAEDPQIAPELRIHAVRRRCKKIRSLIRLVRPALDDDYSVNETVRDAARSLSGFRDAHTMIAAWDWLARQPIPETTAADSEGIRASLLKLARSPTDPANAPLGEATIALARFAQTLHGLAPTIKTWKIDGTGFSPLARGLRETYLRGRRALEKAIVEGTTEQWHEVRKWVKYYSIQLRFLEPLCPRVLEAHRLFTEQLAEDLGWEHDLGVLDQHLASLGENSPQTLGESALKLLPQYRGTISTERHKLRSSAATCARFLFSENPRALTRRTEHYWKHWLATPPTKGSSTKESKQKKSSGGEL